RGIAKGRARRRDPVTLEQAMALVDKDRLKEAEDVLRQLCIAQPDDAEPRHVLGHVLSKQGQFSAAIAIFEQASELAPDNAALHYSLGRALLSQRAFSAAAVALRRSIEADP